MSIDNMARLYIGRGATTGGTAAHTVVEDTVDNPCAGLVFPVVAASTRGAMFYISGEYILAYNVPPISGAQ